MIEPTVAPVLTEPKNADVIPKVEEIAAIDISTFSEVIKTVSEQIPSVGTAPSLEFLLKAVEHKLKKLGLTDSRLFTIGNLAKILRNSLNNLLISDLTPLFTRWLEGPTDSSGELLMANNLGKYILDSEGTRFTELATVVIDTSTSQIPDLNEFITDFPSGSGNLVIKGDQAFDLIEKLKNMSLTHDIYVTSRGNVYAYKISGRVLVVDKRFRDIGKVELVGDYLDTEFGSFISQKDITLPSRSTAVKQYLMQLATPEYTEDFNRADIRDITLEARIDPIVIISGGFTTGVEVLQAIFKLASIISDIKKDLADPYRKEELLWELYRGLFSLTNVGSLNAIKSEQTGTDLDQLYLDFSNPQNPMILYIQAVIAGDQTAIKSNEHLSQEVTFESRQVKLYQALDTILTRRYNFREVPFEQGAVEVMRKSFGSIPLYLARIHLEAIGLAGFDQVNSDLFMQDQGNDSLSQLKASPDAINNLEKMANARSVKTGCPAILGGNIEKIKSLYLKFLERFTKAGF